MWGCVISCNFLISTWVDIYNFLAFSSVFTVYKSFFAARMHPTVLEKCGNENSMDWVWKYWLLLSLMFQNIWFWFGTLTHILGGSSSHTWSDLKASVQRYWKLPHCWKFQKMKYKRLLFWNIKVIEWQSRIIHVIIFYDKQYFYFAGLITALYNAGNSFL